MKTVKIQNFEIANDKPFVLFGGLNVLENLDITLRAVDVYKTITDKLGINEAPSTIVIGSDRVAQVLTGIIDANVVKQYAGDARRRAAKK